MQNLTLGRKISLGFGVLILITATLGIISAVQMNKAKDGSQLLAHEYVPEMAVAARVRGAANRVMYQMRGYGFTEEDHYYQAAQKELAALEEGLAESRELAGKAEHLVKLPAQLQNIVEQRDIYNGLVDDTRASIARMEEARGGLDENAGLYMSKAQTYLTGQMGAFNNDLAAGKSQAELTERMAKISLINEVINLGNDTRVKAFKAQAMRDPAIMEDADKNFPRSPRSWRPPA